MTRNWIAAASRRLGLVRSESTGRRRQCRTPRLENLERRLSLSSVSTGGGAGPDIIFVGGAPRVAPLLRFSSDLNPQPLPPSRVRDAFLGGGGCHY
jgi:hypothetical protein